MNGQRKSAILADPSCGLRSLLIDPVGQTARPTTHAGSLTYLIPPIATPIAISQVSRTFIQLH
jgi:hypothetical protein